MSTTAIDAPSTLLSHTFEQLASWERPRDSSELRQFIERHEAQLRDVELNLSF